MKAVKLGPRGPQLLVMAISILSPAAWEARAEMAQPPGASSSGFAELGFLPAANMAHRKGGHGTGSCQPFFRAALVGVPLNLRAEDPQKASASQEPEKRSFRRDRSTDPSHLRGPDGEPLAFESLEELVAFLTNATIISTRKIGEGSSGAKKLLLEKGDRRMHAVFRDVSEFHHQIRLEDGTVHTNFKDNAIFECAADAVDQMLDLRMVPPVVRRRIDGVDGSLQAWIEGAIMEKDRQNQEVQPADPWWHVMQHQLMYLFDSLISNEDRHQGNILWNEHRRMVLIDHTRSFRNNETPTKLDKIGYCERGVLAKLKNLEESKVRNRLRPFLTAAQINALLKRRDGLVAHFEDLIRKKGEYEVLFDFLE